jgi:hypothetical protein
VLVSAIPPDLFRETLPDIARHPSFERAGRRAASSHTDEPDARNAADARFHSFRVMPPRAMRH